MPKNVGSLIIEFASKTFRAHPIRGSNLRQTGIGFLGNFRGQTKVTDDGSEVFVEFLVSDENIFTREVSVEDMLSVKVF